MISRNSRAHKERTIICREKNCFGTSTVLGPGWLPPTPWDGASLTQSLDPAQQCLKYKSEPLPFYKAYPSGRSQVPRLIPYSSLGSPKTRSSTPDETSLTDHHLKGCLVIPALWKENHVWRVSFEPSNSSKRKAI